MGKKPEGPIEKTQNPAQGDGGEPAPPTKVGGHGQGGAGH